MPILAYFKKFVLPGYHADPLSFQSLAVDKHAGRNLELLKCMYFLCQF